MRLEDRSTQRYEVRPVRDRDRRLRARVIELARQHPRYGYRRLTRRAGKEIDQLKFTTNLGNTHGPYGGSGGNPFSLSNLHIGGFFGRSGVRVDAIAFFSPAAEATSLPLSDSTTKSS